MHENFSILLNRLLQGLFVRQSNSFIQSPYFLFILHVNCMICTKHHVENGEFILIWYEPQALDTNSIYVII